MSIKRVEADSEDLRAKESPCYFCNDAFEMGKLQVSWFIDVTTNKYTLIN